jgi:hypothetical protein
VKIDTWDDAKKSAGILIGAGVDKIAAALVDAHIEGLEQAINQLHIGNDDALSALRERRIFMLNQKPTLDAPNAEDLGLGDQGQSGG